MAAAGRFILRKSNAVLNMTHAVRDAAFIITTGVKEPGRTRWNRPCYGAELSVAEVAPNLRPPVLTIVFCVTCVMDA